MPPLFGPNLPPLMSVALNSLTYGVGHRGQRLDLNVDVNGGAAGAVLVLEGTASVLQELSAAVIAVDAYATAYDPLGKVGWVYWPSTAAAEVLDGQYARMDLVTPTQEYHIYFADAAGRDLFVYAMANTDPPPAGLAAYIIAQWDVSAIVTTGSDIDELTDQQSSNYDLSAVSTDRATLDTTNGPASDDCISFNGSSNLYQLNGITLNQPHAVVLTADILVTSGHVFDAYANQNMHAEVSWNMRIYAGGAGSIANGSQSYAIGWNTWVFMFDGASSYIRLNASTQVNGNATEPGSSNATGITLGAANGDTNHMEMRITRMTLVDATTAADAITVADEHAVAYSTYVP